MFGIHGKPYVCLDEWCNVDHLKHLVPDVNYGIGKAHQHIRINFGVENHTKTDIDDFGGALNTFRSLEKDPRVLKYGTELESKDPVGFQYWLMHQYPVYEALSYIALREFDEDINKGYTPLDNKSMRDRPLRWTEESKHFESLKQWLTELPYETLGPVILLMKLSGAPTIKHRDLFLESEPYKHEEQFIWFDPCETRHLFVESDGVKVNMEPGTAFYWNHHDWHGGQERTHHVSWALRTEGVFNSELQSAIETQHQSYLKRE